MPQLVFALATVRASLSARLRPALAGALLALPLACMQVAGVEPTHVELAVAGMVLECPVGSAGCPCTAGGACDPGLICMGGTCSYGGDGSGEMIYEFEDDLDYGGVTLPAPAPAREEVRITAGHATALDSKRSRFSKGKKKDANNFTRDTPAAVAPEGATVDTPKQPISVTDGTATVDEDRGSEEGDDLDRQMVYTASLTVAVFELDAAIEFAESLPQRYGGWIESRYDYQITLRLPAERLFESIEQLSALGVVLGKTLRADDVTDEYTDLESRILVLEQLVEQLELLLKQCKTVEEALRVRIELDRVRLELEAARTRMRYLSELIDFSTLTLYLSKRGPAQALPSSNDPFPWVNELGVEGTEYR